jgi:hypothetical protein
MVAELLLLWVKRWMQLLHKAALRRRTCRQLTPLPLT